MKCQPNFIPDANIIPIARIRCLNSGHEWIEAVPWNNYDFNLRKNYFCTFNRIFIEDYIRWGG